MHLPKVCMLHGNCVMGEWISTFSSPCCPFIECRRLQAKLSLLPINYANLMKAYSHSALQLLTMSIIILFSIILLELMLTFVHLYPIVYLSGTTWTLLLCVPPLFQLLRACYVLPHYCNFLSLHFVASVLFV